MVTTEEKLGSELEGGGGGVALISADDNFVSRGEVQNGCDGSKKRARIKKERLGNGKGTSKRQFDGELIFSIFSNEGRKLCEMGVVCSGKFVPQRDSHEKISSVNAIKFC